MAPKRPSTAGFTSTELTREVLTSAAAMERRYLRSFVKSVEQISNDPELLSLLNDIVAGKYIALTPEVEARIRRVNIPMGDLVKITRQAYTAAGRATVKGANLRMSFDVTNPRAISTARRVSAAMVTNISTTTQQSLRDLITEAVSGDMPMTTVRRMISQQVGLLPAHAAAVRRYEQTLLASGMSRQQVTNAVAGYAGRLLRYRAELIARTEVARATSWGQKEAWDQALDNDLVPIETMRVWITAADERVCPVCGPMNGQVATLDGVWLTGNGPVEVPTDVHPQCRCTSGLVFPDNLSKADPAGYERWLISKHLGAAHDQRTHGRRRGLGDPGTTNFPREYFEVAVAMGMNQDALKLFDANNHFTDLPGIAKNFVMESLAKRMAEDHGITEQDAIDALEAMDELQETDFYKSEFFLMSGKYMTVEVAASLGNPQVDGAVDFIRDSYKGPYDSAPFGNNSEQQSKLFKLLREHTDYPAVGLVDPTTGLGFPQASRIERGAAAVMDPYDFAKAAIKKIGLTPEGRQAIADELGLHFHDVAPNAGYTALTFSAEPPLLVAVAKMNGTPLTATQILANKLTKGWAISAGSFESGIVEQAVLRTIPGSFSNMPDANGFAAASRDTLGPGPTNPASALYDQSPAIAKAAEAYVKSSYAATQEFYSRLGVDQVTIGRGITDYSHGANTTRRLEFDPDTTGISSISGSAQIAGGRALSSWSVDIGDPLNFAAPWGEIDPMLSGVMIASVPTTRIYATPFTGIGCLNESEVIFIQRNSDAVPVFQISGPNMGDLPTIGRTLTRFATENDLHELVGGSPIAKASKRLNFDANPLDSDWPKWRTFDLPSVTTTKEFRTTFGLETAQDVRNYIRHNKTTAFWHGVPNKIKTGLLRSVVSKHMRGRHDQQLHAGYAALGRAATGGIPSDAVALTPEVEASMPVRVRPDLRGVVAWPSGRVVDGENTGLVAIGYDSKMRRQYVYTAEKKEGQSVKKFVRIKKAAKDVKKLDKDLAEEALVDDTAAATLLMRKLGMRPGSTAETRATKQAYGATTLEARHVKLNPTSKTVSFAFTGKSGVQIRLRVKDPAIYSAIETRLATKSGKQRLFDTSDTRVNSYIKKKMGNGYTGKDLRTLKATTMAMDMVKKKRRPTSKTAYRKARNDIGDAVSKQLGNTRAEALRSYIAPEVFAEWESML